MYSGLQFELTGNQGHIAQYLLKRIDLGRCLGLMRETLHYTKCLLYLCVILHCQEWHSFWSCFCLLLFPGYVAAWYVKSFGTTWSRPTMTILVSTVCLLGWQGEGDCDCGVTLFMILLPYLQLWGPPCLALSCLFCRDVVRRQVPELQVRRRSLSPSFHGSTRFSGHLFFLQCLWRKTGAVTAQFFYR